MQKKTQQQHPPPTITFYLVIVLNKIFLLSAFDNSCELLKGYPTSILLSVFDNSTSSYLQATTNCPY